MKKLLTLLVFMLAMTTMAQPRPPMAVEPGSKGALPALAEVPAHGDPTVFPALFVEDAAYSSVMLSFPEASAFGGDYYVLQYQGWDEWHKETWHDVLDSSGAAIRYGTPGNTLADYNNWANGTRFRLVLHGGPRDEHTSNVVVVDYPGGPETKVTGWGSTDWGCYVDEALGKRKAYVKRYDSIRQEWGEAEDAAPMSTFQWYRRNPHSYELTLIEGATQALYTPKVEDVGYELMRAQFGDGEHASFVQNYVAGRVRLPIGCSFEYVGNDGLIVNTDYVLDHPQRALQLGLTDWNAETGEEVFTPLELLGEVETRIPGQYLLRTSELPDMSMLRYQTGDKQVLVARYFFDYPDGAVVQTRDAVQVINAKFYRLAIAPRLRDELAAAEMDLFRKNIDDQWKQLRTQTVAAGDTLVFEELNPGFYKVKAKDSDATMETYYPSVPLWSEAETLNVPAFTAEGNDSIFTLRLLPVPPSLTGSGIIEGRINLTAAGVQALDADSDPVVYRVYLKAVGGTVVAQTQTAADLTYRFEHVPFGSYEVLVNLDGLTLEQPHQVTLSEAQPVATNIDYTVNEGIISAIATAPTFLAAPAVPMYDLSGRRVAPPQRPGIYVQDGKKKMLVR